MSKVKVYENGNRIEKENKRKEKKRKAKENKSFNLSLAVEDENRIIIFIKSFTRIKYLQLTLVNADQLKETRRLAT